MSNALIFEARGVGALLLAPLSLVLVRERRRSRAVINPSLRASACTTALGVWRTAQLLSVAYPLLFVFAFAAAPHSTDAFNSYLLQQTPLCAVNMSSGSCVAHAVGIDGSSSAPSAAIEEWCNRFNIDAHSAHPAATLGCARQWGGLGFDEATFALIGLLGSVGSVGGNGLYRSRSPARSDAHEHEHVEPTLEANP